MSSHKKRRSVDSVGQTSVPNKKPRTSNGFQPTKQQVHKRQQGNPESSNDSAEEIQDLSSSGDISSQGSEAGDNEANSAEQPDFMDSSPKTFSSLGVIPELCDACEKIGYKLATPIQAAAIPTIISGRDLIGLAETGSGKTAAYALPMLQALIEKQQGLFGLVLAPTRELAYQISQMIEALGALIHVRSAVIVGGMDMMTQAIALSKRPHIIVATPGRILDHLQNTKGFSLRSLKFLVLDEADRLLDMDFGPSIDKILKNIPNGEARRTMLFSATMTAKVNQLQRASLRNPVKISLSIDDTPSSKSTSSIPTTLKQTYLFFPHAQKDQYLTYLLSLPLANKTVIVFVRIIADVDRLTHLLTALGHKPAKLHGRLSQPDRLASLNKFKARQRTILLATDVAARGLDIPAVDAVVNYDMPDTDATYVHRVGRTARAGKAGTAISLVTQYEVEALQRVEKTLGVRMEEYEGGVQKEAIDGLEGSVRQAQAVATRKLRDDKDKKGGGGRGGRGQRGARRRHGDDQDLEEE
ncbi:MAG: hypothetical protein GOMPHAMPRED_004133 [Gomphillus americanus]|uniref:RNA helicase n=1 Tax=Gomphillus americanus TaxID=1940652 RepID=A0A8H3FSB8_9LECA|nr:MAG: hypothetical protein GOMPHAMPRED_004133 [Gomphillus americanus]